MKAQNESLWLYQRMEATKREVGNWKTWQRVAMGLPIKDERMVSEKKLGNHAEKASRKAGSGKL